MSKLGGKKTGSGACLCDKCAGRGTPYRTAIKKQDRRLERRNNKKFEETE